MADFKVVGKLVIDDKGQLKILGKKAKTTSKEVDKLGTSAHTADRRLKGAAQASSGGTKNFSKMAQGIQGGLVPAYATLAASLFAISALFRGLETAANIKNQTKGMEIFGNATGIAMKGIVADVRAATGGMLDFQTAAQNAQIATAAGFSAGEIKELAKGAKLASVALGRDLTDSFNRLVRGVTKAEPELLDELGIILRIDDATRKYAQANDLIASKLTISQRRTAVMNEVTEQLANNFSAFEDGADGALNSFAKLQVAFSDIIKDLSAFIGPLEYIATFLAQNTGAAATLFAGFALSITKSAFPALTNMTAGLTAFRTSAQSNLRATKVQFERHSQVIRKSGATFNFTELKKSRTFKKFLAKRSMDFADFERKDKINQRRSLTAMINNLKKRQAAGKVINDAELAYFIKTRNQMVGVSASANAKMVAGAKIAGATIAAAITVPAAVSQVALAGVGAAALRLAPIFAGLGSIINAAFFIFTAGFILKFIYDLIFVTKEEQEERTKINNILDSTVEKLKEIKRIGNNIFEDMVNNADAPLNRLNARLLATYNLITGLDGQKTLDNYSARFTGGGRGSPRMAPKLNKVESTELSASILSQLGAVQSLGGGEGMEQKLANLFDDKNTSQTEGSYLSNLFSRDKAGYEIDDETFIKQLSKLIEGGTGGTKLLTFMKELNKQSKKLAAPGEGLFNVSEAAKTVKDTLATMSDGYKPTTFDTLNAQMEGLTNNLQAAIDGTGKGNYFAEINEQLGTSFKSNEEAIKSIGEQAEGIAGVVTENARILEAQAGLSERLAGLGSRKDAFATLEKRKIKELQITEQIADVTNKINSETFFLKLAEKEGEEIAERKKVQLGQQLEILKAQYKEYVRSNTIVGQLQDTFQDGLDDMFLSIINGTASAKDALKQLAIVVIQELQRIAAARLAAGIIGAMSGLFSPGGAGEDIPTGDYGATGRLPNELPPGVLGDLRYGGITGKKGYNMGGIADGPQSGYNVTMHGREAIVPLPNGDKIPVQLTGGTGPVNSTINVVVNNEGDVETSEAESTALGEAIQSAVTREIADQQRPGGLLSPI